MQRSLLLTASVAALAVPATAQYGIIADGSIASEPYGDAKAVQAVQTEFGDNASELDAAYVHILGDRLYLALTGNIEGNFNKLEIFIDSVAGGENVFSGVPGNDGSGVMTGLTFDAGFAADYHVIVRRGFFGTDLFDLDIARLGTPDFSSFSDVFGGSQEGSASTGTGPANASPIEVGYDNSNVAGVMGGSGRADQVAAAAVTTGLELGIALSDLGSPVGDVRILAFVNGSDHNFASNQFLGALAPPQGNLGGDGTGAFTGVLDFDLGDFAGDQFFTCEIPCPNNDDCFCALHIAGDGFFAYDTSTATTDGPSHRECNGALETGSSQIHNDVWFAWTPEQDCDYDIATCASPPGEGVGADFIAIYDTDDCSDLASTIIDCNHNFKDCSSVQAPGLSAGTTYLIRVGTFSSAGGAGGPGTLQITGSDCAGEQGTAENYCVAFPNSVSAGGGIMGATGSLNVDDNDTTLTATGVPNNFGLFFFGSSPDFSFPFGDGVLCVSQPIIRLDPEIVGSGNMASQALDFFGDGPENIIEGGSIWFFQYWYRDPGQGSGFNTSDGLEINFAPFRKCLGC